MASTLIKFFFFSCQQSGLEKNTNMNYYEFLITLSSQIWQSYFYSLQKFWGSCCLFRRCNHSWKKSLNHPSALIHKTHAHTEYTARQRTQREGTEENRQLLFHEQVFVFMLINETRIQLNEANEEEPHLALLVEQSVSGGTKHTHIHAHTRIFDAHIEKNGVLWSLEWKSWFEFKLT